MPRKTISFELDFMIKDIISKFTVKQFDDVTFNITPLMNNVPYTTTNMTGVIYIGCDNDLFQQNADIVVSNNNINIKLNKTMLQNCGRAYAELELKDSNGTVTSSTFLFNIEKKIGEGSTIPGSIEGFVAKYERLISEFKSQVNLTINNCNNKVNSTINNCNANVDNKLNTVDNLINTKISDFEKRFNRLTSSQQQDAEVIDARDGETSLKARLDRDIEKAKEIYVDVEGSHISTDSSVGYLKDVEIKGNTIQDPNNLADIRSVGDKVEGQELYKIPVLSCGKNICKSDVELGGLVTSSGVITANTVQFRTADFIPVASGKTYIVSVFGGDLTISSIYQYDSNYSFIKYVPNKTQLESNCRYIKIVGRHSTSGTDLTNLIGNTKLQIEEGTVATSYEPYQEDKLTILSPVQLEKVGDVADRIIEKNGVLGVKKNIGSVVFDGSESWGTNATATATNQMYLDLPDVKAGLPNSVEVLADKLQGLGSLDSWTTEVDCISIFDGYSRVRIKKVGMNDLVTFKSWLKANNFLIKYKLNTPQFIPLPHSQQVKLRTFANKTNISFLTEIEGTLVAQVPKSLGATVNTHTTQISNLNKELYRVKKLEESTVSTVETESDFTTVEATSNGYFEDVKLEGKTLVNLATNSPLELGIYNGNTGDKSTVQDYVRCSEKIKVNSDKITLISEQKMVIYAYDSNNYIRNFVQKDELIELPSGTTDITYRTSDICTDLDLEVLILEGDHTQNPPSYFEGLKSVGEGVDEIVVSSVNENLFSGELEIGNINNGVEEISTTQFRSNYVRVAQNTKYNTTSNLDLKYIYTYFYDSNKNYLGVSTTQTFTTPSNCNYIRVKSCKMDSSAITYDFLNLVEIGLFKNELYKSFISTNQDKKRLLFYNEESQTWEKPILREWDSVKKHSNGKYYYHVRSIEEDYVEGDETVADYITDMTKTVKKLSQEKVYECTNIDLITYEDGTNYIVECGAIVPKSTLKVHNNISNVVSLLQKKVSLLEDKVIDMFKQVLSGDMQSLAYILYPEDFNNQATLEL